MITIRNLISRLVKQIYVIQPLSRLWWLFLIGFVGWTVLSVLFIRLRREKFWQICSGVLSVLFVAVLLYITVASRSGAQRRDLVFRPLYSFYLARTVTREYYRSMLMNVFLFFPLGLMLPFALPERGHPVLCSLLIGIGLSVCFEAIQYVFALGWTEIDDVIMNTLGVLIGGLSFPTTQVFVRIMSREAPRDAE